MITPTHAHSEIRKVAGPAGATGVKVLTPKTGPNTLAAFVPAPARTVNADGLPVKPQGPANITKPAPTAITGGSPIMAGADRTRTTAKPPVSTVNNDFVAVADMVGVLRLRPGDVERLQNHGISIGVRNGVLCIARQYIPSATGIILQSRGQ